MTIKEELRQIALDCIDSEEFTKRAKYYLKREKEMEQPLMSDSELRDLYYEVWFDLEESFEEMYFTYWII